METISAQVSPPAPKRISACALKVRRNGIITLLKGALAVASYSVWSWVREKARLRASISPLTHHNETPVRIINQASTIL